MSHKRSSFEIEPIFKLMYSLKARHPVMCMYMPAWRALGRFRPPHTLTHHTYAVLPARMWLRVFGSRRGRE